MDLLNNFMSGYTPILIFIFLCFTALLIFFIKLSRNLEELIRIARYDRSSLLDQLGVMQTSLEELVRYEADTNNFLHSLYQEDTLTPIEESDQPYAASEDAYQQDTAYEEAEPAFDTDSGLGEAAGTGVGKAAGAALAGAAAGVAAGALLDEPTGQPEDLAHGALPDLADLIDDDEAFFDADEAQTPSDAAQSADFPTEEFEVTLDDTLPPVQPAGTAPAAPEYAENYEAMAEETMEFDENDYAHYSSALAEKQAKEDFSITPEADDALSEPGEEALSFDLEDVSGQQSPDDALLEPEEDVLSFDLEDVSDEQTPGDTGQGLVFDGPDLDLDLSEVDTDGSEIDFEDISLDLESPALPETDLQDQIVLPDALEEIPDDDLIITPDDSDIDFGTTELSDEDLRFDSAAATGADEDLDFTLDDAQLETHAEMETDQGEVPELTFHEEPESQIIIAPEEEDDSIYLLDEPLTTDEESVPPPSDALQEFELDDVSAPVAPLSADEELDMDLFSDTVREPASYETVPDDALPGEIVMDFPGAEGIPAAADDEFDIEPQHIDLDFQLEDESESDQGITAPRQEEEFVLEGLDDEDDLLIPEEEYPDEDDNELDQLVDNLLDVPEEVNLDADAEDSPDFETAIVIDDDDEDEEVSLEEPVVREPDSAFSDAAEDLLPEDDLAEDDLVLDSAADDLTDEDALSFNFDQAGPTADAEADSAGDVVLEPQEETEISTQDMMLTLDETIELDKAAAPENTQLSLDDTFITSDRLLGNPEESSPGFLLEGLMDLPGQSQEHGFSFSGGNQDDPFSLQDLDITVVDQSDGSISLDAEDEEAAEDDIVLPDISFKTPPEAEAAAVGHADNLLELETDDLVDESQNEASQDETLELEPDAAPASDAGQKDAKNEKKSANILDFIIDQ